MKVRKDTLAYLEKEKVPLSSYVSGSSNFIVVSNSKTLEEEIDKLFQIYPPLNDGVPVELKQSVEYENKAIYFG